MRVAFYARVSTRDKDQDPQTQLHYLKEEAPRRGWDVVKEYVDVAGAGDLRARHAWAQMLSDARKGQWDAVAVVRLDRAFRSVVHMHTDLARLSAAGRGFICATQPVDTTTAMGRFTLTILAAVAEFEKDIIGQRTREGLARAASEGRRPGRPAGSKDSRPRRKAGYLLRYAHGGK